MSYNDTGFLSQGAEKLQNKCTTFLLHKSHEWVLVQLSNTITWFCHQFQVFKKAEKWNSSVYLFCLLKSC